MPSLAHLQNTAPLKAGTGRGGARNSPSREDRPPPGIWELGLHPWAHLRVPERKAP